MIVLILNLFVSWCWEVFYAPKVAIYFVFEAHFDTGSTTYLILRTDDESKFARSQYVLIALNRFSNESEKSAEKLFKKMAG